MTGRSTALIPLVLLCGFAAPNSLERGIALYWSGQYEETIDVLTRAQRHDELRNDEKIECLKYIGFSYVAVGDEQGARDAFAELLASDPHHELDESLVSPKIVRQFEASRTRLVEDLFQQGKMRYFDNEYAAARMSMSRVLALDTSHALAREYLQLASEQEELIEKTAALNRQSSTPPPKEQPLEPVPDDRVYRLTGQISPPVLLSHVKPDYPLSARRAGKQGKAVITLVIGIDGAVTEAKIIRGLSPDLDQAALEAVRRWRYRPARMNGRPVAVYRIVNLDFQLDRQ